MSAAPKPRAKPGRPLKPLITKDAAIAAAIELVDRDGLAALSVQAVARAMNVTAPSLYHHFKDKDELLQRVARALLLEVGEQSQGESDWEDRAMQLSIATRRVVMRHCNAAPLMLSFFPRSLMLDAYETMLRDCPYPPQRPCCDPRIDRKTHLRRLPLCRHRQSRHSPAMPLFDAARYPLLADALASSAADGEALFVETIRLLFEGFRARIWATYIVDPPRGDGRPVRMPP
jgi:TetR/AcrR family tetracycline transcriptional repressor